jgi:hypothetical protein
MKRETLRPALVFTPYVTKSGIVKACHVPMMPEVTDCCVYPEVGEEVHAFRTAYDRIGHVVMQGETMEELMKIYKEQIVPFRFVDIQENNKQ